MNTTRKGFWTGYQPGFRSTGAEPGTPEFFAAVDAYRWELEPHIPAFAGFASCRGLRVLELGCGMATDGARFARGGADYTGMDFSPTALQLARRRFEIEGLPGRFIEGDIAEIPFEDGSFDLVYSFGVIHHLAETERVVAEAHRVLRPGGRARVMVYHRHSINHHLSIMVVRRLLAGALLIPGALPRIARLTGESEPVLAAHRALLDEHGLGYLRRELFLSNNTDGPGNPLSKVYSREEARRLFSAFAHVATAVRFLNLRSYPGGRRLTDTPLGASLARRAGWHLLIEATR